MQTTTLFTILAALFFALFTCTSALPTPLDTTTGPRSLLGRTFSRHAVDVPSSLSAKAVLPVNVADKFVGRADRFQALQRRRAGLVDPEEGSKVASVRATTDSQPPVAESESKPAVEGQQPRRHPRALPALRA